ncbi:MAG: hypothetical protein RUMPE_00906 [Eubacteriales bacterium SKADARSKE-1]|nr:hypothetical protein [Eubacteriales bacterium SKADARSKE-1]
MKKPSTLPGMITTLIGFALLIYSISLGGVV